METPASEPISSSETFREALYRKQERAFSGRVNPVLAEVISRVPPGRALDLGCGEGGDAIWLAAHLWQVTAVDVAPTALQRVRCHAADAGVAHRVAVERVAARRRPRHDRPVVVEPGPRPALPPSRGRLRRVDLDPAGWHAERLDAPEREAFGPNGERAVVTETVVAVRRRDMSAAAT